MSPTELFRWLGISAAAVLVVCSVVLALCPRDSYPSVLRFGPLAAVCAYLLAVSVHFLVEGPASVLLLPVGCFGLYLAVRSLSYRSALARTFAASSLVFWLPSLFFFGRYVFLRYLHHPA